MIGHSVVGLALAVAVPLAPAAAQQQPDKLQPAPEIIAALPDTLVGAAALKMPNSPMVMYMPKNLGRDPLALVMATRGSNLPKIDNMAQQVRGSFHESGLREIVREGTFTTPKWPNASTFFGEYVAGSGRKQSWTLIDGDDRINVMVTYYKAKDGPRLQAEVAEKIFGGAVVTAGKGKVK